jgi:hypothetical protein
MFWRRGSESNRPRRLCRPFNGQRNQGLGNFPTFQPTGSISQRQFSSCLDVGPDTRTVTLAPPWRRHRRLAARGRRVLDQHPRHRHRSSVLTDCRPGRIDDGANMPPFFRRRYDENSADTTMTAWLGSEKLRRQSEKEGHFLLKSYDATSGKVCDGSEARNTPRQTQFRCAFVRLRARTCYSNQTTLP